MEKNNCFLDNEFLCIFPKGNCELSTCQCLLRIIWILWKYMKILWKTYEYRNFIGIVLQEVSVIPLFSYCNIISEIISKKVAFTQSVVILRSPSPPDKNHKKKRKPTSQNKQQLHSFLSIKERYHCESKHMTDIIVGTKCASQ